jgi:pimeloyl-ACP methyl ester carboxylesterase
VALGPRLGQSWPIDVARKQEERPVNQRSTRGAYAPINGLELYFERHGQGPALVLLHGGLLNIAANFSQLLPPLTENHEVIAIELQGHGRTADSGRAMSLECFADDVAALLAYLSIEKADVFGFSLGAMVALTLALSHPGVVNKLVLASVDHSPNHDQFVRPEDPAIMARLPTEADFARLRTSYAEIAPRPGDFDVLAERTTAMVHSVKGWSEEELASITAPTLVLVGDTDMVPLHHAVAMFEALANAQLAVLPGTTHMEMTKNADRVLALVRPFLEATP